MSGAKRGPPRSLPTMTRHGRPASLPRGTSTLSAAVRRSPRGWPLSSCSAGAFSPTVAGSARGGPASTRCSSDRAASSSLDAHEWAAVTQREGTVFDGDDCKEADASAVRGITDKVHDALTEFGITRQSLWSVLVLAGRHHESTTQQVHLVGEHNVAAWVASRPARLEESEIQALATVLDREFPAAETADPLATRWPPSAAPLDVQKLTTALFRTATARPVERWMTFLDEAQLALITTSWDGPARLTGPAGTGKTVVGLAPRGVPRGAQHRAGPLRHRDRRDARRRRHAGRPADAAGPRQRRLRVAARPRRGDPAAGCRAREPRRPSVRDRLRLGVDGVGPRRRAEPARRAPRLLAGGDRPRREGAGDHRARRLPGPRPGPAPGAPRRHPADGGVAGAHRVHSAGWPSRRSTTSTTCWCSRATSCAAAPSVRATARWSSTTSRISRSSASSSCTCSPATARTGSC